MKNIIKISLLPFLLNFQTIAKEAKNQETKKEEKKLIDELKENKISISVNGTFSAWGALSNTESLKVCDISGGTITCKQDKRDNQGKGVDAMLWGSPKIELLFEPNKNVYFKTKLKLETNKSNIVDEVFVGIKKSNLELKLGSLKGAESMDCGDASSGRAFDNPWKSLSLVPTGVISENSFKGEAGKSNKIVATLNLDGKSKVAFSFAPQTNHSGSEDVIQNAPNKNGAYLQNQGAFYIDRAFQKGSHNLTLAAKGLIGQGEIKSEVDSWKARNARALGISASYKFKSWHFSVDGKLNSKSLVLIPTTKGSAKGGSMEASTTNGIFKTQDLQNAGGIFYYNPNKANAGNSIKVSLKKELTGKHLSRVSVYTSAFFSKRNTGFSSQENGKTGSSISKLYSFGVEYKFKSKKYQNLSVYLEFLRANFKNNFSIAERFMQNILENQSNFSTPVGTENGKEKTNAISFGLKMKFAK